MDGTLYKFDGSGSNNAIFNTMFYDEVTQNVVKFLSNKLFVSLQDAKKIREDIFERYKGDISIGLEKEFGLERELYFTNTWNIYAAKYCNEDVLLQKMLLNILTKKVVLTNAPQVWAKNALRMLGIADQFERIYSGEGDIRKPQKEAYLQICEAFGIKPDEVMIVEDEPQYLKPAKELGMTTVLISSSNLLSNESYVDYTLKNIYDLVKIVREK